MSTLCQPAVLFPQYKITQTQMIEHLEELHGDHPRLPLARRMIQNTEVNTRHLVLPIDELSVHTGFTHRSIVYEREARAMSSQAALEALDSAGLTPQDIRMVIVTSCTGFMMPSLTAHLINDLNMAQSTIQLPIAQLGCVAGAAAINRANDFASLDSRNHVLIVSLEFSSLCYQPDDTKLHAFISSALFGDAVSACVVRADDEAAGFHIKGTRSFFLPNSEHFIRYDVKDTGFHFTLDKAVMNSIKDVAPVMEELNQQVYNQQCAFNDFFVFHTGGRKILDELVNKLELPEDKVAHSRTSLSEAGNIASVVVFDVLRRRFAANTEEGSIGMLAAFGPGFTAEMAVGQWAA
ncbi:type III polyketide synthase [Chromobacterium amazonense]|uniref:Type III polyketide synthase n=1 Tax=Chromobacterium amazonense TaxID=1382803 RepID=A0ABU8V3K9_9NEIS|nr:type III polyketide synthase [Chromobacterium amazonense]KIA80640.1 type III polyketide synthase PhlD [Chromobacterium piscinae]MDE1716350.1 type III polyketide synthase [Chromobacterium amazonense]MDQ4541230.1 type III polyketide synthase [Chromobacterium amazonense]